MARIPLVTENDLTEAQRRVYEAVVKGPRGRVQGPMLAALHNPELADKWQQFGEILRYRTSFPPRFSELAILKTARAWNCQLEWHFHERHALNGGLESEIVEAIRAGRRPDADEDALAIYDFTAELLADKTVSEATYNKVLERWGVVGVVELTALIGYYAMVAMTLNAHDFPMPDGASPPLPKLE
jgi:4-carboxymuconolactone decarboxylase